MFLSIEKNGGLKMANIQGVKPEVYTKSMRLRWKQLSLTYNQALQDAWRDMADTFNQHTVSQYSCTVAHN